MATTNIIIESDAVANSHAGPNVHQHKSATTTAADVLVDMADTFRERNKVYGSNYQMVGPIMAVLFPHGVPVELLGSSQFHLFELTVVKLSRLAISDLTHIDSAHDAAVYCAMIESIIRNKNETSN